MPIILIKLYCYVLLDASLHQLKKKARSLILFGRKNPCVIITLNENENLRNETFDERKKKKEGRANANTH